MKATGYATLLLLLTSSALIGANDVVTRRLEWAPSPVDNPLKGLVPYAHVNDDRSPFPHSMEFNYLPLSSLVVGKDMYDWQPLEKLLNDISGRGHHAIFRVFLEYPGRTNAVPEYLLRAGLKTTHCAYGSPPKFCDTPDYSSRDLRNCLTHVIAALGKRYDGDRRIGFITAGLLGVWGEWHNYGHDDLWASKEVQAEILDAYEAAFKATPILLRYPAGEQDRRQIANSGRPFGHHDDSFAWSTLDTRSWHFMALMKTAGPEAMDKWKRYPIGGEIRPEAWGRVFDEKSDDPRIQDFAECVKATHVTWLMDSGMFRNELCTEARRKRAVEMARGMGYEFHVRAITVARKDRSLLAEIEVENRGVAPLYHDWPGELALLNADGTATSLFRATGRLTGLLPGDPPRVWKEQLDIAALAPGRYHLALRVSNPLPEGTPLRFANKTQDEHAPGWLTLLTVEK